VIRPIMNYTFLFIYSSTNYIDSIAYIILFGTVG